MTQAAQIPLVRTDDAEGVALLGEVLRSAGYTAAAVQQAFSSEGPFSRDPKEIPLYVRVLDASPFSTLIELFLLGVVVAEDAAAAALAPLDLERALEMAVVTPVDGGVQATLHLAPTEDLLLASDRPDDEVAPADHVLGLSPPTRVLACLTVRRRVRSALDIGTGFGLQALVAASHAERVVATDILPRALRYAEFNALLNGLSNIEFREGSVFDPVEGETFDLIVANPPYVISPESEYIYRDSGLPGDSFCEGLVRRMPEFLNGGGFGHALVAWAHEADGDWFAPLRRWVEGTGCDALLFHYVSHEPLAYAAGWNRPLRSEPGAYASALDRWTAYYGKLGIEAIAWGAVVLRKRAGENWIWAYRSPAARIGPASDHLLRLVAAQDALGALPDDEALLELRLSLAPDHRLDQTTELGGGESIVLGAVLRLQGGIRSQVAVDPNTLQVLARLDGRRTVREVIESLAAAAESNPSELAAAALPALRRLLELGFIVPAA